MLKFGSLPPQVVPAKLPDSEVPSGTLVKAAGWGATSEGGPPIALLLRYVEVPIVARSACQRAYGSASVNTRMLCAGASEDSKDVCQGDKGGPLFHGDTLVGIVSWGDGCGRDSAPGGYANVSNPAIMSFVHHYLV
ncbi:S1 family serine peptidase [Streptomyces niveus]|uniref:S1 family serine peptidase n=1 Tax=Streptomyces niveus TaxID=193462 RepID=UPI003666A2D8